MFVNRHSPTKYQIAMIDENAPETKLSDQPDDVSDLKKLLRVRTIDLMRGSKEIVIEHDGKDYRLRVTSLGKLILTR
jgi:hemin uptake protein HemP